MLGERVAEARKRIGINQSELARRAELTPAAVWQIEKGERVPNAETLSKLSDALGVTADWLLGKTPDIMTTDPAVAEMYRGIAKLSPADREKMQKIMETLFPQEDKS